MRVLSIQYIYFRRKWLQSNIDDKFSKLKKNVYQVKVIYNNHSVLKNITFNMKKNHLIFYGLSYYESLFAVNKL